MRGIHAPQRIKHETYTMRKYESGWCAVTSLIVGDSAEIDRVPLILGLIALFCLIILHDGTARIQHSLPRTMLRKKVNGEHHPLSYDSEDPVWIVSIVTGNMT